MKQDDLRRLARMGAAARLGELDRERAALLRVFPGLRASAGASASRPRAPRGRSMSATARKAVSLRMKKYWADRRKAKAAKG
jgi:hypothetical protein